MQKSPFSRIYFFFFQEVYYADTFRLITNTDHEYCCYSFIRRLLVEARHFDLDGLLNLVLVRPEIFYENDDRNENHVVEKPSSLLLK